MIIRSCAGLLLVLILLVPMAAVAQAEPPLLTADRLIEEALAANFGLAASRAATAASLSDADVADALDDPRLSLGVAPNTIGSRLDGRGLIQVSQTLPWPGKRKMRAAVAASQADASAEAEAMIVRELTARAKSLWADWWYLHEALARNAVERRLVAELLPVAEAQYAAGLGLQQDLLRVETRALLLEHQDVGLQQRRAELRSRINALRGRPGRDDVMPPATLPPAPVVAPADKLAEALRATHPALQRALAELEGSRARLELAERDYWPDFRVYTGYVGTLDPAEKRWQIGAEINLPFGGDKRRNAVTSASLRLARAEAQRNDLEVQLLAELETLLARLTEADRVAALYRDRILPVSQQVLEAARADFESGRGEFSNVIDAETQLLEAGLTLDRARADRLAIAAGIEALTGTNTSIEEGGS